MDRLSDPKTKSSSYLNKMNLNANDDTDVDAEKIPLLIKEDLIQFTKNSKRIQILETEDLGNLGKKCLKLRMKFET